MVPAADVPRSTFVTTHSLKTSFDFSYLVPIHVDEVYPGDVHQGDVTIFARLATPLFPIMDHMELETFFFFVPSRLLWTNFKKFMGERANPADSISYTIPYIESAAGGFPALGIYDFMGVPVVGQITAGQNIRVNALPFRAYNFIWNEWFRDQNIQNQVAFNQGDGPDGDFNYALLRRNKKHDYFTSALPWPLKGGVDVTIPIGGQARVSGIAIATGTANAAAGTTGLETPGAGGATITQAAAGWVRQYPAHVAGILIRASGATAGAAPEIYADLSTATGQTINALRLAFQTQRLLERDARSGTRYTELLRSHFRVTPEDSRLQRPEYIGGGRSSIQTQAIPQTSATNLTGGSTPLGALGAAATASDSHSFSLYASEHGYIIGLANARAELTYQQGLHRMWTRQTRYDFYWPVFAHLGEQAIRNDELYCTGVDATDLATFAYQERWAELRHRPSRVTGLFRSTTAANIDEWHIAEQFGSLPTLNTTFIQDNTREVVSRCLAAGVNAYGMQILFDSVFKIKTTRAMPMFSVPGNLDRF